MCLPIDLRRAANLSWRVRHQSSCLGACFCPSRRRCLAVILAAALAVMMRKAMEAVVEYHIGRAACRSRVWCMAVMQCRATCRTSAVVLVFRARLISTPARRHHHLLQKAVYQRIVLCCATSLHLLIRHQSCCPGLCLCPSWSRRLSLIVGAGLALVIRQEMCLIPRMNKRNPQLILPVSKDSGSQKLHHFSEKCLTSHLHSSVSRGFRTKNSSAIDRAAAARSESDEFFVLNPLVIEQGLIQCLKPPKRCCNFWDPESQEAS